MKTDIVNTVLVDDMLLDGNNEDILKDVEWLLTRGFEYGVYEDSLFNDYYVINIRYIFYRSFNLDEYYIDIGVVFPRRDGQEDVVSKIDVVFHLPFLSILTRTVRPNEPRCENNKSVADYMTEIETENANWEGVNVLEFFVNRFAIHCDNAEEGVRGMLTKFCLLVELIKKHRDIIEREEEKREQWKKEYLERCYKEHEACIEKRRKTEDENWEEA